MHSTSSLAWRNLTAHPLRSILTALAIVLGVGMVLAAAIVGQAAGQSAAELSDEGPRIDLQVFARDDAPFDETALDTLRASPDVERLSPSLRVEAEAIDLAAPRLTLMGVDPDIYHIVHEPQLADGTFLDKPDTIVLPVLVALDNNLRVGDQVVLRAGDRRVSLVVAGRLAAEGRDAVVPRGQMAPVALVPLGTAQTLTGAAGQIDRVEVTLRPGVDVNQAKADLAQRIGTHLAVVRAEVAGGLAFNTALIQGGLAMVGLMILFAAGFVILNAFAMSVAGRTREIGALRALGMTRRQVMRTVLAEAGLLGLIGAGIGVLAGLGLAWVVMHAMGLLEDVPFAVPWWGLAFSPLMGLVVTLVGALQPAWRASRISPIVAVRPEAAATHGWYVRSGGRVGALLLLLLLPGLAAYGLIGRPDIWKAMAATGLGIAGLLAAMVLLLPALVALVATLCRPFLVRWLGTAGRLAADNLGRNRLRSALTAGALVAGLTMIVAASGLVVLFLEGSIGLIGSAMHEDMTVIPDLVDMMASGEITLENIYQDMADLLFDPAVVDALTPLAQAGVIELERVGIAPVPPELATIPTGAASAGMFVDLDVFIRIGNFDFYEGDAESALEWVRRGRAVLLQPLAAERLGVGVGDSLAVETPHGEIAFTVAGIGGSSLFSPIFPYADGEAYFDLAGLFQLGIVVPEGQDVDAILAQVQDIVEPFPGVVVMKDVGSIVDEAARMFDRFRALLDALLLLAVIVAGLGVVNTMVINVTERGREIGLLRAVGATQRQVRQAVVAEAATLGVMAALTAAGFGLLMLLVYVLVVTPNGWGALGMRPDSATTWRNVLSALGDTGLAAAVSLLFGPLVAGLAAYYPARQAAATDVIQATRSERVTLKRTQSPRPERRRKNGPTRPRGHLNMLAWRNLTAHPLRSILTALAIALGVGMVLAATTVGQAASQSAAELSDQGPRVDLQVFARDDAPFDETALDVLRASPDVARLSPSLRVEAAGVDPPIASLALLGVEAASHADLYGLEIANGTFLDQPDSIVLPMMVAMDNGLSVGDKIVLASGGREAALTVTGRLKVAGDIAALGEADLAYVPLAVAQLLNGTPGQIDQVAVSLRPGVDVDQARAALAAQLGADLAVVRAATGGDVLFSTLAVQAGLAMVGVIILFAAAFVIMNAFAMSVTARMREIGALRALGMTRRQVMRQVLAEATALGVIGAALGVLVGVGLAWGVMRARGTLDDGGFVVHWWGVALGVALGLVVTWIGALQPALRASRVSPLVAMRARSQGADIDAHWYIRHGGRVGGIFLLVLLLGLAAAAFILQPDFFESFIFLGVGMVGLLLGTMLVMPALVHQVAWLVRPILVRWLGTAGRLAADNFRRNKLRAVLTAGALTIGLTTIVATSALLTASFKSGLQAFFGLFHEDGMVIPDIPALLASGEMTWENSLERAVEALDPALVEAVIESGIAEVECFGFAPIPSELTTMPGAPGVFVEPEVFLRLGNFDFFEGDVDTALALLERGRAVLLMPMVAERLGVDLGDAVPVQTPHGEVEFTVAGIGGTGSNFTVFSYADGETYFDLQGPSWLGIIVPAGQDVDATLEQVQAVVASFKDVTTFDMRESGVGGLFKIVDQLRLLLDALLLLAVIVAALGVVNTMVINVAERRRELALLRAVGATQRQVRQTVVAEAVTLGWMAALIATVLSLAMLGLFVVVTIPNGSKSVGIRVSWENFWITVLPSVRDLGLSAALALCFGPLVAGLAAYYPARQAAAMDVVEAARSERVSLQRRQAKRPEGRRRMARSFSWAMAWRNLDRHRLRTVLSAIAVALGVATIVATGVIQSGMRSAWESGENKMAFIMEMGSVVFNGVGVITLAAAGFLIFNAFAMTVTQQRRQIGMLRSLGMTRRQVLQQVLVEAVCTGGLGTLGGLLAGPLLGRGILAVVRLMGAGVGRSSVAWGGVVLAAGMGMGITLLSALLPARRAARVSPLTALRERLTSGAAGGKRASPLPWLGFGVIVAMTLYLIVAPPGQWTGKNSPWDWIMVLSLWGTWLAGLLLVIPALIAGTIRALRVPLCRLGGTVGRLIGDNLARAPGRTTLTALTFAVGLMMMIGTAGMVSFGNDVLVGRLAANALQQTVWYIYPFNRVSGLGQLGAFDLDAPGIDAAVLQDVQRLAEGRAVVDESYLVVVPEISSPFPGFPSFVMQDVDRLARPGQFNLVEGDWDTALRLLKKERGLLIGPGVAGRHKVGVGDLLTVTGLDGPVTCTVAGIGAGGFAPMAVIGPGGKGAFVAAGKPPDSLSVRPLPGADIAALEADLNALHQRYGDKAFVGRPEDELESITGTSDQMMMVFNSMVLLAVIAAALGTVNTTLMSVTERRRELGLLRAVGATRRQITAVVMSETALTGLIGTVLGAMAGVGLAGIFALAYGGITFGLVDLPLWQAASETVLPALRSGWLGLGMAPLLAAGAAYPAVRAILRGSAIETMRPPFISPRQREESPAGVVGLMGRGSIRARLVVGTGVLMLVVLLGLVGVVTAHERSYLEDAIRGTLRAMVEGQAGLIALSLPDDAHRLSLSDLEMGQFDADDLLRFRALMDDVSAYGVEQFAIADGDNVALLGLDPRQMGTLLPELETPDESRVVSEREGSEWRLRAAAPIRNEGGAVIGSVRLTVNLDQVQAFVGKTRQALWAVGGGIIVVGLALSWALATPLVVTTGQLTAQATRVARGEYTLIERRRRRGLASLVGGTSLRVRLTAALILIVVALVGALEVVVIPIERHHTESELKEGMVAAAEWIGQAVSEGVAEEMLPEGGFTLEEMLSLAGRMDWARLQELTEKTRSEDVAYVALVDRDGVVQLSDQLSLMGEKVPLPVDTQVKESTWRDEEVWVVSTPLRRGRDGEQVGALRLGVRRAGVETFLDESRNLFRLTGLIAVLAGVLLAQAVGGAVTAPVRQLAAGVRRVGQGDLSVQFRVDTKDELALLAGAFNEMVAGLREREWLRDMFGRFVSREVAEAIRTGQVRLEGENRVVSVLFCDIRDFTARSEQHTPEEIVALLNEYLPLVVQAAHKHAGTVNKFGGDSTLIIYGAPKPLQESAYQAVLTALDMRAKLARLNEILVRRGETPIRIGVGINTGVALAGAVGPEERQEYTVIGDAVNLASRIEGLNKDYPEHDILISGWTYEALGSRRSEFEFADLGEVGIRGKAEPVQVWAVIGSGKYR